MSAHYLPALDTPSVNSTAALLGSVQGKGVKLWLENGQLRYEAPLGTLDQREMQRLKASRNELIAFLEETRGASSLGPRAEPRRPVLLAYSQLAHWREHRLEERPHVRQIAAATRVRGPLSIATLRHSISEVVRRHEALRTQIVFREGSLAQVVHPAREYELQIDDMTALPRQGRLDDEVQHAIERHILEPVNVLTDSLFALRLLKLAEDEHVLIVTMEHIISDGFSRGLLLRDLWNGYAQLASGASVALPEVRIQLADFASWQRTTERTRLIRHSAYRQERLQGFGRSIFPDEATSLAGEHRPGWGSVPVRIDREVTAALRERCRALRTTPAMAAFSAYAALVLRWCRQSKAVIRYQTDGRTLPGIENTLGYFASPLYLRLGARDGDSLDDLTQCLTEELCDAYEHIDYGYMDAQPERADFLRTCAFNWQPRKFTREAAGDGAIVCSPIQFAHPMMKSLERDAEPTLMLFDGADEILGTVYFPSQRFSHATMQRFARNFPLFVTALLERPQTCIADLRLV